MVSTRGEGINFYLKAMKPSLNRDVGRVTLSPIWHNIVDERIGKGVRTQSC